MPLTARRRASPPGSHCEVVKQGTFPKHDHEDPAGSMKDRRSVEPVRLHGLGGAPKYRRKAKKVGDNSQFPISNSQFPIATRWEMGVGNQEFDHLERGSGRIWKRMSLLVVPLPPSMWNGARVAIVV